jgi:hypothetical protein
VRGVRHQRQRVHRDAETGLDEDVRRVQGDPDRERAPEALRKMDVTTDAVRVDVIMTVMTIMTSVAVAVIVILIVAGATRTTVRVLVD